MTQKEARVTILLKYESIFFFPQQNFMFINLGLRSIRLPLPLLCQDSPKCTFPSLIQLPVRTHIYTLIAVSPWLNCVHCGSEHLLKPWVWKGSVRWWLSSNCSEGKKTFFQSSSSACSFPQENLLSPPLQVRLLSGKSLLTSPVCQTMESWAIAQSALEGGLTAVSPLWWLLASGSYFPKC